jgi:hypothetical protein
MKWIGQHIYDFVSRFRNETTFERKDNSGLDSNRTTIINGDEVKLANSSNASGPLIDIRNTADNNTGATIDYYNLRANPADDDKILLSRYLANNDNGELYIVGQQLWKFADVSDGAEKGFYGLSLAATLSAGNANFFEAEAKGTSDIDVKIALGSSSTTTIRGDLTVSGGDISLSGTGRIQGIDTVTDATDAASKAYVDAAINSDIDLTSEVSGVLPIANGGTNSSSTTYCSLTANVSGTLPVANGGTGASSLTDNKILTGTGTSAITAEANATYDGTDLTLISSTSTKPILSIENTTNDANAGELKLIGRRSTDASVIAANGDDTGKITFVGENNKSGPDPETLTYGQILGEVQAVTDGFENGKMSIKVAEFGSLSDVLTAHASGLGSVMTFGNGNLLSTNEFQGTITNFTSTVSTGPIFGVYNYTDDATGPAFTIGNLRGGIAGGKTDGSDNDSCGVINFAAYDDGTPTQTTFAKIEGIAKDVSNGAEEGKLTLNVASHDGEIQPGLTIESGDAEDEVDVTIGNGSASVVTVPGFISIGGHAINDIDVAGEFVDSDEHLMTAAAINDQFGGGGGGVTADPFSTTVIKVLPNQWVINDDAGRPLFVEDDTSNTLGVRCFTTTDEMYAWQKLPSGYKATHVQVHASASTSSAVSVRSYNYQTGADNAVSATTGNLNANIDITDIPSSATQDLVIKVSPGSGSTIIFGATVTIATI